MFTVEMAAAANAMAKGTLMETLGIAFCVKDEQFCATMPVRTTNLQPAGLLHGGATAALAESLGSAGSALLIDLQRESIVGIEVNANHLRGVRSGNVIAVGELVHRGRRTHVWNIRVMDEAGEAVAVCRLTNLVIQRT
jgi:1,4-dihydroxy-2-naphthoyl-CoA hydrolase